MILPPQIDGEIFRAQDEDDDVISIGQITTPSGAPGVYIGTMNSETECQSAVILTPDEAVELAMALGKALYGLPE